MRKRIAVATVAGAVLVAMGVACSSTDTITPAPSLARDASEDVIPDASFDVASDDGAIIADGFLDDGGSGEGCVVVSGQYKCGLVGDCTGVKITCPPSVDVSKDCATACPASPAGRAFVQCYPIPPPVDDAGDGAVDDGGGAVLILCMPGGGCCQG
jgi:hypothetical protein